MFHFDSDTTPVESLYQVFFNKTFICESESLKVVITTWKDYKRRRFVLKLYAVDDTGSRQQIREQPFVASQKSAYWPYRHMLELHADSNVLGPGYYYAEVYLLPAGVGESDTEQYLIREHTFQILPIQEYVTSVKEMFGESWDEPVYLDSYKRGQLNQLNDFFLSWELKGISDYEIALKTNFPHANSRGHSLNQPNNFEQYHIDRIQDMLVRSMSRESPLPFRFVKHFRIADELPAVDLTKCFWLLSVLGEAWADALFLSVVVTSEIYGSDDSLSVFLTPHFYDLEKKDLLNFRMPNEEPVLFHIVRQATEGSLNFELRYESNKAINLVVKQTQTFLSKSAVN